MSFIKKVLIVWLAAFSFVLISPSLFHNGDKIYYQNENIVMYDLDTPQYALGGNSLREVFEDGGLFQDAQLLSNPNFTSDTVWTKQGAWSISGGVANYDASAIQYIGQPLTISKNNKYYFSFISIGNQPRFSLNNQNGDGFLSSTNYNNGFNGIVFTPSRDSTEFRIYASNINGGTVFTLDNTYLFNISTLIANKQYSPIYTTTFDLMSDAQIKIQMDSFVDIPEHWVDFDTLDWYPTQPQLEYFYNLYVLLVEMGY